MSASEIFIKIAVQVACPFISGSLLQLGIGILADFICLCLALMHEIPVRECWQKLSFIHVVILIYVCLVGMAFCTYREWSLENNKGVF